MQLSNIELEEMRKGLRKRKLPKISEQMFGEAPGIGSFKVTIDGSILSIEWVVDGGRNPNEKRKFSFQDLSFSPDLEKERYELGMLMSTIYSEHGREIRNSIPGPHEAMMESNPYFVEAEKWEHWAKVAPGFFLK
jgi:hypothetical protein